MHIVFIGILIVSLAIGEEATPKTQNAPRKKGTVEVQEKDPVQKEYEKLLEKDEAALTEFEKVLKEYQAFESQGVAGPRGALSLKLNQIVEDTTKLYQSFLDKNPAHVEGYLAFGSFLSEIGDEEAAIVQWEKARELDPKNPASWNNLANLFGHIGPIKKAFQYYEKAIELDPMEPVYFHNLATTTYLFRKDAAETYRIDEQKVFDKSLELYRQAMKLDPTNLVLATDFAQSYYGIQPLRTNDALNAWNNCLTLAKNDVERQGLYLHLARVFWMANRLDEAQKHLDMVKESSMGELKNRIQKNVIKKRKGNAEPERKSKSQPTPSANNTKEITNERQAATQPSNPSPPKKQPGKSLSTRAR